MVRKTTHRAQEERLEAGEVIRGIPGSEVSDLKSQVSDPEPNYTILVVDDDEALCRLIQTNLQREGFHTRSALNGAEAIDWTIENSDALLLVDYRLPDMTGKQVIETVAQQRKLESASSPTVPFIIMTGHGDERVAVEMMKLGARDYLVKDADFLDLLPAVVNQVIEQLEIEKRLSKAEEALWESEKKLRESMVEKRLIRSEKLASIGRLSANLVHELSNPLDGALRYIRLLLDQMPEDDPRRIYAQRAQDGLTRMSNMVGGLLDFARKSRPILSPTDIPQSIAQILASFNDQILTQNIQVKATFDENIPVILNADVEQIFMNIIKNAIQAMPDGGTLYVNATMFSPELFEARFGDTGPGIPHEVQEAIFDPFFTTKDIGQGVGLGLSISHGIAESYSGSIDLESEPGKGTTFIVRLPIGESGLTVSQIEAFGTTDEENVNS
jgi:signal transduction histidine kinase